MYVFIYDSYYLFIYDSSIGKIKMIMTIIVMIIITSNSLYPYNFTLFEEYLM